MTLLVLFIASVWIGVQNALAGGGYARGLMGTRVHEKALRFLVVLICLTLTVGLFPHAP
jgi:hypothetical protein